jgi:hypothetical protein
VLACDSQVIIVARECGLQLELEDIKIDKLVPDSLQVRTCAHNFKSFPCLVKAKMLTKTVNRITGTCFCRRVLGEPSKF